MSGMSHGDVLASFDKDWLQKKIRKYQEEINQASSAVEGFSSNLDQLQNQMETAEGLERQRFADDIRRYEAQRRGAYERIEDLRSTIAEYQASLNDPSRP